MISRELITAITDSIGRNKSVRRKLPNEGRLHIDRQLPFLFVYRRPPDKADIGTERLVLGEAAYLLASGSATQQSRLVSLIKAIAAQQSKAFGGFLLIEVWAGENMATDQPGFRIVAPHSDVPQAVLERLESALLAIGSDGWVPRVEVAYSNTIHPPGIKPLFSRKVEKELAIVHLGLEIAPIYRDTEGGTLYPFVLRDLHHGLGRALKRACYTFTHTATHYRPAHYQELGRRAMTQAVRETDRALADIGGMFDLLLHVSPVNVPAAWNEFKRCRFQHPPEFLYRPRPVEPALLKRRLFQVPIERIEDPTLAHIFFQKREELDCQLNLIALRNKPQFLLESRKVFGDVEPDLIAMAQRLLSEIDERDRLRGKQLDVNDFVQRAREEIAYYRQQAPDLAARVELRDDVPGILVSRGNFLVGRDASVPAERVRATLAHEIGTHILTHYNGSQQPFRELYTGMSGYEPLQEGIAVLAEYLVGELNTSRLRLLAGRVFAVHLITSGADFIETFRELNQEHGFPQKVAYNIAMRIFRGGGYTKDVVYLRGLAQLLDYLGTGRELEWLLLGKVAFEHIPFIEELCWRQVLSPGLLRPRYLDDPQAQQRLERLSHGMSVFDLVEERQ